ncbi:unnamed protein product [Leptosia nina]|uniref:Uncharacterized protein n=1 Tax=Leptosia nina TaxID=320188 RepID=A0AAV1JFV5_9NEOP
MRLIIFVFIFTFKIIVCEVNEDKKDTVMKNLQKDWHVSKLKSTNFHEVCEDNSAKYKKQKDAALIEFVSSDPLPFKESDLIENMCIKENKQIVKQDVLIGDNNKVKNATIKSDLIEHANKDKKAGNISGSKTINADDGNISKQNTKFTTVDKNETKKQTKMNAANKDTATTVAHNVTKESRRVHDYQFSSVEYYDEHPDFDEAQCPDDVEVVVLEIDELRSYDLECELMIEWRSLD